MADGIAGDERFLESNQKVNTVNAGSSPQTILVENRFRKQHQLLPLNGHILKADCGIRVLVKRCRFVHQSHKSKPCPSIICSDLDVTVLEADVLLGVCDGDVEGKVVGERVVGFGVVELGKGSIVDGEFRDGGNLCNVAKYHSANKYYDQGKSQYVWLGNFVVVGFVERREVAAAKAFIFCRHGWLLKKGKNIGELQLI